MFLKTFPLFIVLLLTSLKVTHARVWNIQFVNAEPYVTIETIQENFKLDKKEVNKNRIKLSNKKYALQLHLGNPLCYMNGIKFEFSTPTISKNGKILVSALDVQKLIQPILEPKISPDNGFKTVVIDPGHGGKDPGTIGRFGRESDINLSIAHKLKHHLVLRGYKVVMTREGDTFLTLQEREAVANAEDKAIVISIHQNSFRSSKAKGVETFTMSPQGVGHPGREDRIEDGLPALGNRNDYTSIALATAIHGTCVKNLRMEDRGLKRARFNMLQNVKHPAVLLECGFLSHPEEGGMLSNTNFQEAIARCITNAIFKYRAALGLDRKKKVAKEN